MNFLDIIKREVEQILLQYYKSAKDDDAYNANLLKKALSEYNHVDLILGGFEIIAQGLVPLAQINIDRFEAMGMTLMYHHLSLIKATGDKGYKVEKVFQISVDDDTKALAAFMLSNPYFEHVSTWELKKYYENAYNSSYQLALAWALFQHGEKSYLKTLATNFFYANPPASDLLLESAIYAKMTPQYVFGIIAADIASNGQAYDGPGKALWRRKRS